MWGMGQLQASQGQQISVWLNNVEMAILEDKMREWGMKRNAALRRIIRESSRPV